eukprot:TRINITY_DN42033_c0_g1_i1.p1 TRINITY_DN42033_c0_g1~~TRINITY_DN42033_c0_g1_i1.p1  ORF type:complete len:404 (+),score=45.19 TRINITY_DN42033_c0_g1_i1:38-1213(+)
MEVIGSAKRRRSVSPVLRGEKRRDVGCSPCSSDEEMYEAMSPKRGREGYEDWVDDLWERKRGLRSIVVGNVTVEVTGRETVGEVKRRVAEKMGVDAEMVLLTEMGLALPADASFSTRATGHPLILKPKKYPQFSHFTFLHQHLTPTTTLTSSVTHTFTSGGTPHITSRTHTGSLLSTTSTPHPPHHLSTHNNTLYASLGIHGVVYSHISGDGSLTKPKKASGLGGYCITGLSISGENAVATNGRDLIQCRLLGEGAFEVVKVLETAMSSIRVLLSNGTLYVLGYEKDSAADRFFSLPTGCLKTFTDTLNPLSTTPLEGCSGLSIHGPSLYVAISSDDSHIVIFNVLNPSAPRRAHVVEWPYELPIQDINITPSGFAVLALNDRISVIQDSG